MTEPSQSGSTAGKPTEQIPCPAWCTDHATWSDISYHASAYTAVGATGVQLTESYPISSEVRVFGLDGGDGESMSLDQAEKLAWVLLGMVAAARRETVQ